jgi:cephalosporin-C deacetylase-like acetyl esterase
LWFGLFGVVSAQVAEPKYKLAVTTDRPDALYGVGDKVEFVVTLEADGRPVREGQVSYALSIDGAKQVASGTLKLDMAQTTIHGTLPEPGFLLCRVSFRVGPKQTLTALAGAGIGPQKIPPSLPVPDDFDEFWSQQKARLKAVPVKPVLTPVASADKSVESFDVQAPCAGGMPVSGYFARPKDAKPKSLPAILFVHGAGVRSASLGAATGAAKLGALGMDINAHGIPNGKPAEYYEELGRTKLKDYRANGRESRETCYFLGMFLRLIRAIDFLTTQPEWDGRVVCVSGASQGGGQSIAAAGLDPRVTFIATGVPAICDHTGSAIGRINGWPKLVPNGADGKPDPKILQAARYFDCMNLATRAKAEAIFSVGFIDVTCPPTSVYATYNNYGGKKQIIDKPLMGHTQSADISQAFHKAMWEHIRRMKSPN